MKNPREYVVYTAVFGNYDTVAAVDPTWDCDFICFTDNPSLVSMGWDIVHVSQSNEAPALANRRFKILAHRYLEGYKKSLYVDGNFKIIANPSPLFPKYLNTGLIAIPVHQERKCIYMESKLCIKEGRVDKADTEKQISKYAADGFPENFGLWENGLIFRRHHDPSIVALMESWWLEYCEGGRRDQLALPYLIWKTKINVVDVVEGPRVSSEFFQIELHNNDKSKSLLRRFVRKVSSKKRLSWHWLIISKAISLLVTLREKFPR